MIPQKRTQMYKPIKLLSYNVFLRPPPIKTNEDDYKQQRFAQILQLLDDYDILCFQEMFQTGSFRAQRLVQYAISRGFFYWKKSQPPAFTPGPVVDSGLIVISRYPILASSFQSYDIGILSDSASDKGYIYCKIRVRQTVLHLFLTHLQASYMEPGQDKQRELSVKVRQRQQSILIDRIKYHLQKNFYHGSQLVLLVGDMNVNAREQPFRLTKNSCLKSAKSAHKKQGLLLNENDYQQLKFSQYQSMIDLFRQQQLQIIDHLLQKNRQHPPTFGCSQYVLTGQTQAESYQRLDYIFTINPFHNKQKVQLKAITKSCQVQSFKRPNCKHGQLSDHYGLSISIE